MKNILKITLLLMLLPITMSAGISFDTHETTHGVILVQKLKCSHGGEVVLFYLRDTVKTSDAPTATIVEGCKLKVEAGGKVVFLRSGDVGYYSSKHRFAVIHVAALEQGGVDQPIFERLVPLMELLPEKIGGNERDNSSSKPTK